MITTWAPAGCFFQGCCSEQSHIFTSFLFSLERKQLHCPIPSSPSLAAVAQGCLVAAEGCSGFPRKQHQAHPSSPRFLLSQELRENIRSILPRVLWLCCCFYF